MPKESLQRLYDGVSAHLDIGDYDTFTSKMQNTDSRKRFYEQVSQELDIGDFTKFEASASTQSPAIQPKDVFIEPQYSFTAAPTRPKPGVMRTENTRPLPFFNENPETLLLQPGGKKMLQEYGYIVTEPEEKLTTEEIAQSQNKLFLQREIAKEKQTGLSERDAYLKVKQDIGATPANVVDLAMEKSITGSVFRIFGMDQTVDISDYPANKLEDLVSGAIAMIMPADAALFGFGGKAANIKQVGKYADKAANILVKKTGMPIGQARVLAKTALQKITGGAGGFAAFDAGRDITSQIEHTGTVDPIQAVAALMKGAVIGGSVGSLGMAGSYFGKSGEFVGEVFGLGTVSPLLEGEAPTVEGYFDAAATIVGLKFLNGYKKYQSDAIIRDVAEVIKVETETSGRPMHEVANKYGQQLKTSLQLTLEGKTPEKKAYTETIILGDSEAPGVRVHSTKPERVQLNEDIKRISENMDALEKSGVEQRILDELQIEIDSKVERLNEVGVGEIEVEPISQKIEPQTREQINAEVQLRRKNFQDRVKAIESQLDARDKVEFESYNQWLKDRDILNREREYDPYEDVPLSPPEIGKERAAFIDAELAKIDFDYKKLRSVVEQAELESYLEGKDILNRQFEPDPMMEVPLHPADVGRRTVEAIKKELRTVDLLDGQKKEVGIGLQKQFSDLDVTLKANEKTLKKENLTPIQRENLEKSKQKIEELKRDTQERAESNGIELQAFFGIPNPRLLKQLFGSSKIKPTKYSNTEIDRLYNNAIARLEKDAPKEEISIKTPAPVGEPMTKTQGWVSKGLNWFTSDMVERVASVGTPTSKEAAELGRRAIDISKQTHGELSKELDIVLRASGSGKAAKDLARFIEVEVNGQPVIMSRLLLSIENLIPVKGKELDLVEKGRDLIEKRGRIFEKNEIMQEGKDGEVRPFKVMGRNIAPRIMSGEFYRILDTGTGSTEFNTLVNEFAKTTGESRETIKKSFVELKENMTGDAPSTATRTTQAEHSRQWKQIPHAIKLNGELIPLVEYRPYEYARRLADTGESRIGVATVFGQELANTSIVNKIKKQIDAEGGSTKEFHEMIRALSGAPVETTYMDVGFTGSKAMRGIKGVYNIIKQTSLSASLIPNVFEILGNIKRFSGAPSMLKSIFKLTKNPIAVNDALETLGAITIDIGNFSVDPNRPISSRVRAINEAQRRGFLYKYMNEFQEKLSAVAGLDKVEKLQKGKGTGKDAIFLREMGFSRAEAELMVSGKAPQELYNAVIRRAPAHLTGGAARTGEQSRLERNKIFRVVSAFETYAQMKIRSLSRVMKTNQKVMEEAINEKDYKKMVDSSRAILSELTGSAVSGMTTQFLLAYMYGGEDNVEIKWNEVKENPRAFIIKSWAYTSFAGLYGSILQSTAEGGDNDVLDVFYPWVVVTEAFEAAGGKGKYTYDEGFDRLWKFNQRFFPANRVIKQFTVAAGFGNEEAQKDDNSIKSYYRWKIKNKYGGRYTSVPDDEIKNFRSNMIKAYKAIRMGQDPSIVTDHTIAAIDGTGKDLKSIASSIRGKKLLTKSRVAPGKDEEAFNERLSELRRTIGDKAYERLQRHDMLLDAWSDVFN